MLAFPVAGTTLEDNQDRWPMDAVCQAYENFVLRNVGIICPRQDALLLGDSYVESEEIEA